MQSAIYQGFVTHSRLQPVRHNLRYPAFFCLVDLDEIDALDTACRLFSVDRVNLFSVRRADYAQSGKSLRESVLARLAAHGIDGEIGRISLFTMPRVCGYGFNPISVYYCYDTHDCLAATIYDVTNMRRERISYALPVNAAASGAIFQSCPKAMRVSPFTADRGHYSFHGHAPVERATFGVLYREAGQPVLKTLFSGRRVEFCDRALLALAVRRPLQSVSVVAAIHFEALRLWLKGVPLASRRAHRRIQPAPAAHPVRVQTPRAE